MKSQISRSGRRNIGEAAFVLAMLLSAFGIALEAKASLGISMIEAPAYLLSLKLPGLSFGMGEWIWQGFLLLLCCLMIRRFDIRMLWSLAVVIPYGWLIDLGSWLLRGVTPTVFWAKLLMFLLGCALVSLGIALYFRTYLPPLVYELFVKRVSRSWDKPTDRVKLIFDWSCFAFSVLLSLLFFRALKGIGIGTLICTVINAPLIALFGRILDRYLAFDPFFPGIVKYFD